MGLLPCAVGRGRRTTAGDTVAFPALACLAVPDGLPPAGVF